MVTYSRDAQREGEKLYAKGDYADAAGAFRNSTRQNPRSYEGYYWLGMSYEQIGQWQQAIASYKTARQTIDLTIEGKNDDAMRSKILSGLASAVAKSDERDVETDVAASNARNFGGAESWFLLAKIYAYRGDADSAIDAFNRAMILEPNSFMIAKDYGLYMERVGQKQRAEAPLRRAYSLNNEDPEVAKALRRIGIVPGPGLLDEDQLARPIMPKGPIPEVNSMLPGGGGNTGTTTASKAGTSGTSSSSVQVPRD